MVELLLFPIPHKGNISPLEMFLKKEWSKIRIHKILEDMDFYHHSSVGISTYTIEVSDGGKPALTINLTVHSSRI